SAWAWPWPSWSSRQRPTQQIACDRLGSLECCHEPIQPHLPPDRVARRVCVVTRLVAPHPDPIPGALAWHLLGGDTCAVSLRLQLRHQLLRGGLFGECA